MRDPSGCAWPWAQPDSVAARWATADAEASTGFSGNGLDGSRLIVPTTCVGIATEALTCFLHPIRSLYARPDAPRGAPGTPDRA